MKTALIVLSDPNAGTEEALGRVFNALAVAHEFKQAGATVQVLFAGAGTRWPAVLNKAGHPAHALYKQVLDTVAGVSCGCADVFGADDQGLARITTNAVPGTTGLPSVLALQREGYQVITF
ncbi:MAG: DsrE family protein [Opitutaceae bacterium]